MKISHRKPEIYESCHKVFGVNWDQGIIITYGDTIYFSEKFSLSPDLEVHESTHIRQQTEIGKEKWWEKYFEDPKFRLSQELEAYKNQVNYLRENCSRQYRRSTERKIYKDMATIYGDMCSEEEARKLLQ